MTELEVRPLELDLITPWGFFYCFFLYGPVLSWLEYVVSYYRYIHRYDNVYILLSEQSQTLIVFHGIPSSF